MSNLRFTYIILTSKCFDNSAIKVYPYQVNSYYDVGFKTRGFSVTVSYYSKQRNVRVFAASSVNKIKINTGTDINIITSSAYYFPKYIFQYENNFIFMNPKEN